MPLYPCRSIGVEKGFRFLVRYLAPIAQTDGSVNNMECNKPLLEHKVTFALLIELSGYVD